MLDNSPVWPVSDTRNDRTRVRVLDPLLDGATQALADPKPDHCLIAQAVLAGYFLCELQEVLVHAQGNELPPLAGMCVTIGP
jgi:hypothetical protein